MDSQGFLLDLIKVGVTTLVTSKITKAIGEKDISELIAGAGICICGVDLVIAVKPLIEGIGKAYNNLGNFFTKLSGFTEKLGGMDNILGRMIQNGMVGK